MNYRCISDKHKNLINNISLHPTGIDNRIMGLKNIVNRYLKEKDIDVIDEEFDLNIFIKNLTAIDDKINMIVEEHEPKEKVRIEDKKGVISILHKTRKNFLIIILIPILLLNCINNINIIKGKINTSKKKKTTNRKWNQSLNCKQPIKQTSSIISTSKSWK